MYAIKTGYVPTYKGARKLEQDGDLKGAADLYEKLYRQSAQNGKALQRLMIVYRKLKNATKEIKYIDAAIKLQEQYYAKVKKADKLTTSISNKLNILLGHTDKKGKAIFKPDEILKLELRKMRLQHKMK